MGSSIVTAGAATSRATNFKVVVTLEGEVPDVRPGFTCTAVITTATREKTVAVPIQAMTVREMLVNADGSLVRATPTEGRTPPARRLTTAVELEPGQSRKEIEGVFMVGILAGTWLAEYGGKALKGERYTGPFADQIPVEEPEPGEQVNGSK